MNIWRVLGLEPTRDLTAIRRAYAATAKRYHPEEQPELFQQVRAAYEQALAYARTPVREAAPEQGGEGSGPSRYPLWERYSKLENKTPPKKNVATGGTWLESSRGPARSPRSGGPGQMGGGGTARVEPPPVDSGPEPDWLREETPEGQAARFREAPAMAEFRELWRQQKKRGDKKAWREYFSSPAFLAVQREEGFTAALLEFVEEEVKNGQQLPQRFLLELVIAYGIRYNGKTPVYLSFAAFPGADAIRDILLLGHPLDRLSHEEDKVWAACWRDYFELLSFAKNGGFEDPDKTRRWKELFDRYRKERVTDRPEVTRKREEEVEYRHPYGLRLLTALVANHPLPAAAAQYLYDTLQLEKMASGSAKKDYKPLLDALLPVLPDQGPVREERETLAAVKKAVDDFLKKYDRRRTFPHTDVLRCYDAKPSPEEIRAAQMLVESPAFQQLLFTKRLEESGVLDRIFSTPTALVEALVRQIGDRIDDPAVRALLLRCLKAEYKWIHDAEVFFDRPYPFAGAGPDNIALEDREFWHYYLSTAFSAAFSTDSEEFIGAIIEENYHPSLWWRRAFTGFDEATQRIIAPRSWGFSLGEHRLTIEFHMRYQIFLADGEKVREKFPWEELLSLAGEDDLLFWLALPLAVGRDQDRPAIRREVKARLSALEVYGPIAGKLTDCLVNHLVTRRGERPTAARGYREDGELLYGYEVREDRTLEVYRANGILRRREKLWDRPFASVKAAEIAAVNYIETLLAPPLRLLERRPVAGAIPLHKAKVLADCLGEGEYTQEDRERDENKGSILATDDFLDLGVRNHGSYTANFYRKYLHHPYRAGVRFGSQEGERFFLEFALEVWPFGGGRAQRKGELLTQLGMLGEAAYFIGCIRMGKTRYTLISNSQRKTLFAVREGTSNYHSGRDLADLLAGMLTWDEWEAIEYVERYENTTDRL